VDTAAQGVAFEHPVAGVERFPAVAVVEGVGTVKIVNDDFSLLRLGRLTRQGGSRK
jgi:hypothetical protein